ncbi:MAG: methyl-accepting chemotaxis protein, partial [Comamonadaceae bacterium]
MFHFATMSIVRRLVVLIACSIIGIVLLAAGFLLSEHSLILAERESSVRQTVEIAHGLLSNYQNLVTQGKITNAEAQQLAKNEIRQLRYNNQEYFWINDMQPTMVMHPIKPELEGQNLANNQDPTGKHLFQEFVSTVKTHGGGFVTYMWPKPGSANPVKKVSYVKGFTPWGWVIGSGVYLDTVDDAVLSRAMGFALGCTVLIGLLMSAGALISRSILQQLGGEPADAMRITQSMAQGDLTVAISLKQADQASLLAAIALMRNKFAQIVKEVRHGSESVATASSEIAQGNQDLSNRTESQASTLEQTAASMEELSSTVKQNADNAAQANQLAMSASSVAVQGGEVVA